MRSIYAKAVAAYAFEAGYSGSVDKCRAVAKLA